MDVHIAYQKIEGVFVSVALIVKCTPCTNTFLWPLLVSRQIEATDIDLFLAVALKKVKSLHVTLFKSNSS